MSIADMKWDDANLPKSFFANVAQNGKKPFLFDKIDGQWTGQNWDEIADKVRRIASALLSMGVAPGDRVVIASENRSEWAICDLAVMSIGAIVVPAYVTNTEDDHRYILEHSGAVCAFVSGGMVGSRLILAADQLSAVKNVISFETDLLSQTKAKTALHAFEILLSEHEPCRDLPSHIDKLKADDTCCFIYTSGTGGRPKGVMLTHRSIA